MGSAIHIKLVRYRLQHQKHSVGVSLNEKNIFRWWAGASAKRDRECRRATPINCSPTKSQSQL